MINVLNTDINLPKKNVSIKSSLYKDIIIDKLYIKNCVDMFENNKNIKVNIDCNDSINLYYNESIIKQFLLDIISNSFKFNKEFGKINISCDESELKVYNTLSEDGELVNDIKCLHNCFKILNKPRINIEFIQKDYYQISIKFN